MVSYDTYALICGIMALVVLGINFFYATLIVKYLQSRGIDAKYSALRWKVFSYMETYKKLTLKETGQVGPIYVRMRNQWLSFAVIVIIAIWFSSRG